MLLSTSNGIVIAVDLIVIPRSCSSLLVSIIFAFPARSADIMPALAIMESVSVDFP